MYVCNYPTIPAKQYQPQPFFHDNLHTIMEDILVILQKVFLKNVRVSFIKNYMPHALWIYQFSSFSFWKFHWLTLISNWRKSSKPCCHSKPLITQRRYGHQQRTQKYVYLEYIYIYIHIYIYKKNDLVSSSLVRKSAR